jgi:hypothetical protein
MTGITKIALAMAVAGTCFAQSAAAPPAAIEQKYFKLEFTVKEVAAGKLINSRKYVVSMGEGRGSSSIRSGDKIPVSSGRPPVVSYIQVGVNIDCQNARETPNGLALSVTTDISSTAPPSEANSGPQIIRNYKWSSMVLVPLKKATVVFSSDDPTTNHQMQLELLATPIA